MPRGENIALIAVASMLVLLAVRARRFDRQVEGRPWTAGAVVAPRSSARASKPVRWLPSAALARMPMVPQWLLSR